MDRNEIDTITDYEEASYYDDIIEASSLLEELADQAISLSYELDFYGPSIIEELRRALERKTFQGKDRERIKAFYEAAVIVFSDKYSETTINELKEKNLLDFGLIKRNFNNYCEYEQVDFIGYLYFILFDQLLTYEEYEAIKKLIESMKYDNSILFILDYLLKEPQELPEEVKDYIDKHIDSSDNVKYKKIIRLYLSNSIDSKSIIDIIDDMDIKNNTYLLEHTLAIYINKHDTINEDLIFHLVNKYKDEIDDFFINNELTKIIYYLSCSNYYNKQFDVITKDSFFYNLLFSKLNISMDVNEMGELGEANHFAKTDIGSDEDDQWREEDSENEINHLYTASTGYFRTKYYIISKLISVIALNDIERLKDCLIIIQNNPYYNRDILTIENNLSSLRKKLDWETLIQYLYLYGAKNLFDEVEEKMHALQYESYDGSFFDLVKKYCDVNFETIEEKLKVLIDQGNKTKDKKVDFAIRNLVIIYIGRLAKKEENRFERLINEEEIKLYVRKKCNYWEILHNKYYEINERAYTGQFNCFSIFLKYLNLFITNEKETNCIVDDVSGKAISSLSKISRRWVQDSEEAYVIVNSLLRIFYPPKECEEQYLECYINLHTKLFNYGRQVKASNRWFNTREDADILNLASHLDNEIKEPYFENIVSEEQLYIDSLPDIDIQTLIYMVHINNNLITSIFKIEKELGRVLRMLLQEDCFDEYMYVCQVIENKFRRNKDYIASSILSSFRLRKGIKKLDERQVNFLKEFFYDDGYKGNSKKLVNKLTN